MGWRKVELLPSAARTATVTTAKQYTPNIERLMVFIDATDSAATPSVVPAIRAHKPDPKATADDAVALLTGAAITGAGNTILQIGPGLTEAANLVAADLIPAEWDVILTHADADSITYAVSAWIYERP